MRSDNDILEHHDILKQALRLKKAACAARLALVIPINRPNYKSISERLKSIIS